MILALVPGRVIPPPKMPQFPQSVEPGGRRLDEPNVWPGMQVLLIDVLNARFVSTAAQRTAPDGKVFVASSHPLHAKRLAHHFASLEDQVQFLGAAAPTALPLVDESVDRAYYAVRRSSLAHVDAMAREAQRVLKPGAQLAVMLDLAAGRQARYTVQDACAAAGFEQVAKRRWGWQRIVLFRA